jgi:hypothetical protein
MDKIKGFGSKVEFEAGFSPADNLWKAGSVEDLGAVKDRIYTWLSQRFDDKETATVYQVSTHGGTIKGFMDLIGHPNSAVELLPGQMIPIVITAGAGGVRPAVGPSQAPKACPASCPK